MMSFEHLGQFPIFILSRCEGLFISLYRGGDNNIYCGWRAGVLFGALAQICPQHFCTGSHNPTFINCVFYFKVLLLVKNINVQVNITRLIHIRNKRYIQH